MIAIVNKRTSTHQPMDFYIGRGSPLGNPYTHRAQDVKQRSPGAQYLVATREEAIVKYERWLIHRLSNKYTEQYKEFYRLVKMAKQHDIRLVCFCAPLPCHGDVIKREIEKLLFPDAHLHSD